jgi:hypothetical protein
MAVRTDAVDRLLEALSPTLAAELERVVNETRDVLEQEFQKRLESAVRSAVRDAELVAERTASAQLERAVAEAREGVRRELSDEFERKLQHALEDAALQARNNLDESNQRLRKNFDETSIQLKSEWNTERSKLQEQLEQWRSYADAQRQLGDATSQAEILMRFLRLAEPFAAAIAVYVAKSDGLALWKSRGQAVFPEVISEETTDPEFFFKTVAVRGRTVAAVCAAQPYKLEGLSFLVATMERAVEFFGLKLRMPSSPKITGMTETTVATAPTSVVSQPPQPPQPAPVPQVVTAAPSAGGDDHQQHAQARRAARLLISEIKLYHERELKEGREHSDIYRRLQKEIDQGREMYKQQVSGDVLSSHDYFHEELVRILTENDPSRLGETYPGPMNS